MAQHNDIGKLGEQAAVEFLLKLGHQLVAQNYRFGRAEIDIITKHNNIIVFTEVKTRATNFFGFPEESVDVKKIKLIKTAAEEFIYQNKIETEIRFDIISINHKDGAMEIHHIPDAFFEDNSPIF